MPGTIVVENLSKTYGRGRKGVRALKDISFSVEPGEVFALLGPNGAGKTTLLKILLDLVRPSGGAAFIGEHPVGVAAARRSLGYLPETNEILDVGRPEEFLSLMGRLNGMPREQAESRTNRLLEEVGLGDTRQPISDFSKGMKRRLALAQALMHEPDVLLLDEPTDGLDPLERERVTTLLRELAEGGAALLLCSHVLPEVETVCDRFLIIHEGRSMQLGRTDELAGRSLQDVFSSAVKSGGPARQ